MTTSLNVSGTWKTLSKVWINVSGTWKECTKVWLNVGGTWKEVFSAGPITLTGGAANRASISPANAYAGWRFQSDGTVDRISGTTSTSIGANDVHRWDGNGGAYIRIVESSLVGLRGGITNNTWVALSTSPSFYSYVTDDGGGSSSCSYTVDIATDSGGTNIVATGTYTSSASVSI